VQERIPKPAGAGGDFRSKCRPLQRSASTAVSGSGTPGRGCGRTTPESSRRTAVRLGAVKWPDWKKGSQFMRHILEAARGHGPQLDDQSMLLVRIL